MKQILQTLILCLVAVSAFGQIKVDPVFLEAHYENQDLSDNWLDLTVYFDITNESNDQIAIKWERILEEDCVSSWDYQNCDNNQCYSSNVTSNIDPEIGLDAPFYLGAGETFEYQYHILPRMQAGCCRAYVQFSLVDDPTNILATTEIDIKINDPDCAIVSVNDVELEALKVFPNPVSNMLQVSNNEVVETVRIYNILGTIVKEFDAKGINEFNVSDLVPGTYLVALADNDQDILKTLRITKQ